jgi:hypothetical protein
MKFSFTQPKLTAILIGTNAFTLVLAAVFGIMLLQKGSPSPELTGREVKIAVEPPMNLIPVHRDGALLTSTVTVTEWAPSEPVEQIQWLPAN